MRALPAFVLLAVLAAGCAGTAEISEDALPLVPEASQSLSGLADYLRASDVKIQYYEAQVDVQNPGVASQAAFEFIGRTGARTAPPSIPVTRRQNSANPAADGGCTVLEYETVAAAVQFGPRSGGGGVYLRQTRNLRGQTLSTVRPQYKPTYRFGRLVAICSNEPPEAERALRALQAVAEPDDRPSDAG